MTTEAVAQWMIEHGYATGHGDTLDDLLTELVGRVRKSDVKPGFDRAAYQKAYMRDYMRRYRRRKAEKEQAK